MKLLITGINGFLGGHLLNYFYDRGFEITAIARGEAKYNRLKTINYIDLDLTNSALLNEVIVKYQPNIIIHTAAMSKPNECEKNCEACILNNVVVTETIVNATQSINAKLIFTSTDFVFGEGEHHTEISETNPLNFYGNSKLVAENYIQHTLTNYCIVRPVFIYGKQIDGLRGSFVQWIQSSLQNGSIIKVVNDQLRTPTYVDDICYGVEMLIKLNKNGVYHLAGEDILTPYQMAIIIARKLKLNSNLIIPVDEISFPEPVRRAKKSILNINKSKTELNFSPTSFIDGLNKIFG
ncbi:MAG: SDR family oxidoreductase [Chitinophagaceae bacterium]